MGLEASFDHYKNKWDSLNGLEDKIKSSAEKKFNAIKRAVKLEIGEEILDEVRARPSEVTHEDLDELREEILEKLSPQSTVRPSEVTQEDLAELREEFSEKLQSQSKKLPEEIKYEMCREQAFSKRHNLIVFGLVDNDSSQDDLSGVRAFFADQMGLRRLNIHVTYRLGQFRSLSSTPRPLVVQFSDIRDRWRVWNSKGKIKYDFDSPIRIQEDLPKRLREDLRVLHRIAKVAKQNPELYGDV